MIAPILASTSLIWAGLILGGSLIAAPAKFQVSELSLQLALQVGRAQFTWLGYAEWVMMMLVAVLAVAMAVKPAMLYLIPISIFLFQQLWLKQLLHERSDAIISGITVPESNIHILFVLLEVAKLLTLAGTGMALLLFQDRT